jgi:Rrf2 family protein
VRISAKTEYACIAVLELAERYQSDEPVRVRSIAEEHGIPSRFLVQILLQLKGAGLVTSTRGAAGGYQLAKPPEAISLGEVMSVVEGAEEAITSSAGADSLPAKVLLAAWQEISDLQHEALRGITFADLLDRVRERAENMYYI